MISPHYLRTSHSATQDLKYYTDQMTSSVTAYSDDVESPPPQFPSGSRWGSKEVAAVGFAEKPDNHELASLNCEVDDSSDGLDSVLERLSKIFAIPEKDMQNEEVIGEFSEYGYFYSKLAVLLKPPSPDTPRTPQTRNLTLWSPSVETESSIPDSSPPAATLIPRPQKTDITPTQDLKQPTIRPPPKSQRFSLPTTPTPLRPEPKLPFRSDAYSQNSSPASTKSRQIQRTAAREEYEDLRGTIQLVVPQSTPLRSESTYYTEPDPSEPSSEISEVPEMINHLEEVVNAMIDSFLYCICNEHGNRRGFKLKIEEAQTLTIPIHDGMNTSTPDKTIFMHWNGKAIPILDYEVWIKVLSLRNHTNHDRENASRRKRNTAR